MEILNKFKFLFLALVSVLSYVFIIYLYKQDSKKCDTTVTMFDKSEIRCKDVFTSASGLTNLETCDGQNISVPLYRILNIKHDKNE